MPLYEYTCNSCQDDFELLVRGSESPACPACGGRKLDKHFSVPAAHSANSQSLPVCGPAPSPGGGCGLPICGTGGCQME